MKRFSGFSTETFEKNLKKNLEIAGILMFKTFLAKSAFHGVNYTYPGLFIQCNLHYPMTGFFDS